MDKLLYLLTHCVISCYHSLKQSVPLDISHQTVLYFVCDNYLEFVIGLE